jgi:hypothetical protein
VFVLYTLVDRALAPSTDTTTDPYAGISGTLATLQTSTTAGGNTVTTGGAIGGTILIRPRAATASSSLKAPTIADFRPTNLLDGDLASAWNEGAPGSGIGEWVRLDFDAIIPLDRIEIANGHQKDADRFSSGERVKSLELQYSDGTYQVVQLLDEQGLQLIKPKAKETEWIKLTILSVYPTHELEDAALSEVRVYQTIR